MAQFTAMQCRRAARCGTVMDYDNGTGARMFHSLNSWPTRSRDAIAVQQELRDQVVRQDDDGPVRCVAGVDVGFEAGGTITRAAVAVLTFPDLLLMDWALAREPTRFPYIPGLLSFRELPAVLRALDGLHVLPDVILCDGQGIAHPRRFGIACHLGVMTGIACVGVAKSRLIGTHGPLAQRAGAHVPLLDGSEEIGKVLRSRSGVAPLYVSVGHRVSLKTAVRLVQACRTRYRLPETTRWAHYLASVIGRD